MTFRTLLLASAATLALSGAALAEGCDKVVFSDVGWTDITATSAATTLVLEALGYETETKVLSVPVSYTGLAEGDSVRLTYSNRDLQLMRVIRPDHCAQGGTLAVDMMYGEAARPFLAWAEAHGARGRDGLGMLVEQAAESFLVWRGVRPDTVPVLAALRAEVDAARPAVS